MCVTTWLELLVWPVGLNTEDMGRPVIRLRTPARGPATWTSLARSGTSEMEELWGPGTQSRSNEWVAAFQGMPAEAWISGAEVVV